MSDILSFIIERDTYNSILYAVLGGLFLLSAFHLVMFFQNRDKSYLLYSFYTFFCFLAYIPVVDSGFLLDLSHYYGLDFRSKQFFTIICNSLYFLFFAHFLNVKKKNIVWYRIIVFPVFAYMVVATLTFLLLKGGFGDEYFNWFNRAYTFLITVQTLISFYILMLIKNNLKYYIIFGGVILFLCSIIGEHQIRELPFLNLTKKTGDFIYFIGLFIENLAFSFALGHKQRNIYIEKLSSDKNLIEELKKSEILKDRVNLENERRLLTENEKIKYLQDISELKLSVLQTQMNPHFIFNALNSIKYYIEKNDAALAVNYLTKFSKLIRTILTASRMKEFTLEEELQTIQVYVDIENLRFNNEMDFTIEVSPEVDAHKIKLPPMVLQPYIENAIIHGIATSDTKKIDLKVSQEENSICIKIKDNGIGRRESEKNQNKTKKFGKSLGTKIADEMLKNYFGSDSYSIVYHDLEENNHSCGTMVVLQIPAP